MSTFAGTSWGTLATVGVACMGVAEGLGVPLEAAAGAVCVGAFFGDKISPLSDSTVITATVTESPLMEGIRHALLSTGPAYLMSLVFFMLYGMHVSADATTGATYDEILRTLEASFSLNPLALLPVPVVVGLILWKKPSLPTFVAGIAAAAVLAMILEGASLQKVLAWMYGGFSIHTDSAFVDKMLNRGGFTSMLGTIGLLMSAAIFGAPLRTAGVARGARLSCQSSRAPLRTAGVADVLLGFARRAARSSRSMSLAVMALHALLFMITGAYYVSYPVVGAMTKDMFPEYRLAKKNLMRMMLDTGTGLAPLVPWSTTGSYTASTLGVANMAFLPFAPMLWLSIVLSALISLTGVGLARISDEEARATGVNNGSGAAHGKAA